MISLVIELITAFTQFFISIATTPNFTIPAAWSLPMNYLKVFTLDFDLLQVIIPELDDYRIYFLLISIVLPLTFIFFGLVFINPFRVVMWYLFGVVGVLLFSYGCFIAIGADYNQNGATVLTRNIFLIVGAAILIACFILFMLRGRFTCCETKESTARALVEVKEEETKAMDSNAQAQRFCLFLLFGIAGALFVGLLKMLDKGNASSALDRSTNLQSFAFGIGITLLILAGFVLIYMIMGCFKRGREIQWSIARFFDLSFLRLLLVTLSLTFIPIAAGVFVLFNCNDFFCPAGKRMIDVGSMLPLNSTKDICPPCPDTFAGQRCPALLQSQICNNRTLSERLEEDRALLCSDLKIYFWPAAFLVIIQFLIGVPLVFHNLIQISTNVIAEQFTVKLPKEADATDDQVVWSHKVAQCDNVARFMFQPFKYAMRYTRLYQLIQKVLIVFTGVFVFRTSLSDSATISLSCALVIHTFAFIALIYHKPFIRKFENVLSIVMEVFLILACIAALLIQRSVTLPDWALITILVMNGVLPLAAFFIGIVLEWTTSRNQEEQEAEERRQMLEEELQNQMKAEDEEENKAAALAEGTGHDQPQPLMTQTDADRQAMLGETGMAASAVASPKPSVGLLQSLTRKTKKSLSNEEMQRRRVEIALKIQQRQKEAAIELLKHQQDTDLEIDRMIKSRLNKFLMAAGVFGFLALACCLVGIILADQGVRNANLTSFYDVEDYNTSWVQLVGYSSWDEMTLNCCCIPHHVPRFNITAERWVCRNQRTMERLRRAGGLTFNNSVRDLCAVTFQPNCVPAVVTMATTTVAPGKPVAVAPPSQFGVTCDGIPVYPPSY